MGFTGEHTLYVYILCLHVYSERGIIVPVLVNIAIDYKLTECVHVLLIYMSIHVLNQKSICNNKKTGRKHIQT